MSDRTDKATSRLLFLRRHRTVATIGAVALASAIGGALIGGAISASGSDQAAKPGAQVASDEVGFAPPPEFRQFQQCMKDHGVVLPPPPGAPGDHPADQSVLPADPKRARADCEPKLGPRADDAELYARIKRHVECMRDHGVDLPDPPPPSAGPFSIELPRDDPDVPAARQACDHLLFEDSGR